MAQGGDRSPRWEIPGFDISKDGGWRVKARRVAAERARLLRGHDFQALNAAPAGAPAAATTVVSGTIYVPVVLFYYQDVPIGPDIAQYDEALFSTTPPLGRPYTLRTYYDQLSDAQLTMLGQAIGWALLDSNEVAYTGNPATTTCTGNPSGGGMCNGLFSGDARLRMQRGLRAALGKVDGGVNFGQFDNDGPDGNPNSGDDDGFVDMLGFAHATRDGACASSTNNHIWAHRWVLGGGDGAGNFVTNDARFGGGSILIRDYFIQSALGGSTSCNDAEIMAIGTAAHEFGHALGLPDLYDTQGSTEGIGRWGLMGSGNYSSPNSPARMEAWSLNEMGWLTVVPITTSGTYALRPIQTRDSVYAIVPLGDNPRNESFFIENRQALQGDTALMRNACQVWHQADITTCPGGLLIWHIDASQVSTGYFGNLVNSGAIHGVKLEEADGGRDLLVQPGCGDNTLCNRGDAGDVYPGQAANVVFGFASNPAAVKNSDGSGTGFDIDQIVQVVSGGEMSFRVTIDPGVPILIESTDPRPAALMGASYLDSLKASGGTGTYSWSRSAGALPPGVSLASGGVLFGVPSATGTFAFTARVSSGVNVAFRDYSITVTAPALILANVLARLFDPLGTTLTPDQIRYLDLNGNNNKQFDVGDFKRWRDQGGGQ